MSRLFRKSTFKLGDTSRGEDGTTVRNSTLWTTDLNKSGLAQHLIRWRKDNVWDYYDIEHHIGEGSIGTVRLVKRKFGKEGGTAYAEGQKRITNSVRGGLFGCCSSSSKKNDVVEKSGNNNNMSTAIKSIPNRPYFPRSKHTEYYALKSIHLSLVDKVYIEELRNEIDVIRRLDHINIIKAYEVYETKTNIFVIMEYLSGGDLYTRSPYTEYDAASVICQLCSAICFIHKNGVVHRDIKMENIMFETTCPSAKIKVLDFGLSKKYSGRSEVLLHGGGSGTVYTMSPEALSGSYNAKADCWSIGVITYLLLCSERPFKGTTRNEVVQNIKQGKYTFNHPTCWDTITPTAKG
jgi:serine/threonine protein kinase